MTSPISPELLRKYDVAGPRYTSYPTADRFVEAFGPTDYVQARAQRREGPAAMATPSTNVCIRSPASADTLIAVVTLCVSSPKWK